jgi:hypothetical protein
MQDQTMMPSCRGAQLNRAEHLASQFRKTSLKGVEVFHRGNEGLREGRAKDLRQR